MTRGPFALLALVGVLLGGLAPASAWGDRVPHADAAETGGAT